MIKAVFLDRDGTLIYEKPGVYLCDPKQVRLYKSTRPALKLLAKNGFKLFMVSNQSGIGRGYFTEKEVNAVHAHLQHLLKPEHLEDIVFCPHAPDEKCACRKPQPKMGLDLIKKHRVDPKQSYMIGDKKADVEFGHALGCKAILVTTANGKNHLKKYPQLRPEKVATNLLNAAKFIVKDSKL